MSDDHLRKRERVRGRGRARPVHSDIDPTWMQSGPDNPATLTPPARQRLGQLRGAQRDSGALSPLAYNISISHRHRFVWFRNAKVGTRTMLGFFGDLDPDLLQLSFTPYPTAQYADYVKFAFVRDPLDRFISAWQNKVQSRNKYRFHPDVHEQMQTIERFAEWVAGQDLRDLSVTDRHIALQTRLIDLDHVDHLGRIEHFDRDFAAICDQLGVPWHRPDRRNTSASGGLDRQTASEELISIVEEAYRLDYQILGY